MVVEYFKFIKRFEDENTVAKYTIPAPAQMFQQLIVPANIDKTRELYPTNEELIKDIAAACGEVNNLALEAKPADMIINSHICRIHVIKGYRAFAL